jgi:hypothetical protein
MRHSAAGGLDAKASFLCWMKFHIHSMGIRGSQLFRVGVSPFGPWLDALERRSPVKVVITAAANKLARVAWAVLSSGEEYHPPIALMPS